MNSLWECEPIVSTADFAEKQAKMRVKMEKVGEVTRTFLHAIDFVKTHQQTELEAFYNAAFHVNLTAQDIYALMFSMATTSDHWSRYTFARFLSVVLYESADKLPQVFGKPYKDALSHLKLFDALRLDLKAALKAVNDFKDAHGKDLHTLRVFAGAHRDSNAYGMIRGMIDLPPPRVFDLAGELERALHPLARFSVRVIGAGVAATGFTVPPAPKITLPTSN